MSIWQNWWAKLQSPADNVVAAVVVLVGVAITAAVTLGVSALNRRHERQTETRDRWYQAERDARDKVFEPRAKAYLDAGNWLINDLWRAAGTDKTKRNFEEIVALVTALGIYGTADASNKFNEIAQKLSKEPKGRENFSVEEVKVILKQIEEFQGLARRDVQGPGHL